MLATPTRRSFVAFSAVLALGTVFGFGAANSARGAALAKPQGKVILKISGRIANANADGVAEFDLAMLEAIGLESFSTMTPWYKDRVTFEGVPMASLLQTVGADGTSVSVTALNDYTTEIPTEDFTKYRVILALKRDGAYMTVKDKGPLFIVYPYDSDPALKHQRIYSRSAWQVASIAVK
jgi:hypothetical protein